VLIAGAGVGGLATALMLGRAGHAVTVLEHDAAPEASDVEAAFAADRRGAPQVHQTHGFLARLVTELRTRLPDVFESLLAAGCTTMPTTADLGEPQPGDDDLRVVIVRRTTLEWVLRRAALAEPNVELRHGIDVRGLLGEEAHDDAPVRITGLDTSVGPCHADVVVAATGRRGPIVDWLRPLGVELDETIVESGLMYLTRWYRLDRERAVDLDPKLGGDLGFIKYLGVPGDGETVSVTLAIRPDDRELRRALSDPDRFDEACRILPGPDCFFVDGPLEPIGPVRPMGGLLNRRRGFLTDGRPVVTGLHVVGDSHTCTNPLYGRGCALAVVQAGLVADALATHPADPLGQAGAYETASVEQVEPWYDSSVELDKMGADPAARDGADQTPEAKGLSALFVAAATDPVIGRGMVRFWNLLSTWDQLMTDPAFVTRMIEIMSHPDDYPRPPRVGPTREELLAALAGFGSVTDQDAATGENGDVSTDGTLDGDDPDQHRVLEATP
jgi:2-polyprenyl-6-methoxyphenol hydroxylase-like FAD-dependent oxidoreductase